MLSDAELCGACGARTRGRRGSLKGMLLDGRYRIEKKLAAGGFGAIYRATHVPSGNVVALKVLHADIASDPHLSARFRREAAALASLHDPRTVTAFDHGEAADGTLFIAMELLTGASLFDEFHARGPLPWRRMLRIMRGVCSSLVESHALGIVHRDLKPANIHLERQGGEPDLVKVLDFGIAKVMHGSDIDDGSDLTRVGQAIGTLEYMSPEQIVGADVDGRSDLYTLGVVAYEMITGSRPFADATGPTSLMTALMTRTPVPPSALLDRDRPPPEVDRLLLRCLAREPQDRFAGAADLAAAIDAILARSPVGFSPRTTLPGSGPYVVPPVSAPGPAMHLAAPRPMPRPMPLPMPPPVLRPMPRPMLRPMPPPPVSVASLVSFEDSDDTTVDSSPLFDRGWEPDPLPPPPAVPPRSRLPSLGAPPDLSGFRASAQGSTVGPPPRPPVRFAALKIAAWTMALLASGVGLGMLVSTLA